MVAEAAVVVGNQAVAAAVAEGVTNAEQEIGTAPLVTSIISHGETHASSAGLLKLNLNLMPDAHIIF